MERVAGLTPRTFLSGITAQFGDKSAELLSQVYGITPDMDQNLFLSAALRWMGDVVFDGNKTIPFHKAITYCFSTYTSFVPVSHNAYFQESIPLRLRRSQPLPRKPTVSAAAPLGRRLLCLQNFPVPLSQPEA